MDEVEFIRAFNNLRTLVDDVEDTRTANAMRVMMHLLIDLNDRVIELAAAPDEDEC